MNLSQAIQYSRLKLLNDGATVKTERWQDIADPPSFHEVLNLSFSAQMSETVEDLQEQTQAWQPWCETHFKERISGIPYNPPPSTELWLKGNLDHTKNGQFSHTYPERMCPPGNCTGIRFQIGNVFDLIELLKKEPLTRQAYLPIWFPEDLYASTIGERVPCTLGWHFIIRDNKLYCYYPMRSCDALRHFHNDLYLANRLALWIRDQVNPDLEMGNITFHAVSFHVFTNDIYPLRMKVR